MKMPLKSGANEKKKLADAIYNTSDNCRQRLIAFRLCLHHESVAHWTI